MKIVKCDNAQQLQQVIVRLFFDIKPSDEIDWSYEEIVGLLKIDDTQLIPPEVGSYGTEEWDLAYDNLTIDDLRRLVDDGKIPLLRRFRPGYVLYHLENDFDRHGDIHIRIFEYYTENQVKFSKWDKK